MTDRRELVIRRPDDWHLHLRDDAILAAVTPFSSSCFARAIIMPNLVPPVTTAAEVASYRERIIASVPDGHDFQPLMTLYLTEDSDPDEVEAAAKSGSVSAVKLYPAGATTNSESGVRDIAAVDDVFDRMAAIGLPLLVHGEVTDAEIDIFDREAAFIDRVLDPLRRRHPGLRVVMEHVTTADAVDYVQAAGDNLAATITVHHLFINRNALLVGGIRPHYYCLPVAKRERHRLRLREAAISGEGKFFLGTDSAPHPVSAKEAACGCAGIFTAPNAMACLAQIFEEDDALDRLEHFCSLNGAAFYRLDANRRTLRLIRDEEPIEGLHHVAAGDDEVAVFDPGLPVFWRIDHDHAG